MIFVLGGWPDKVLPSHCLSLLYQRLETQWANQVRRSSPCVSRLMDKHDYEGKSSFNHNIMTSVTREVVYSSHPASEVAITYEATLAISSSERRPPKAGMAFFPLVTCVMTAFSLRPPARYCSKAAFSRVFSGMMTFCPPAWHAAQLALKTCSPAPTSPAKAGETATPAVTAAPATAALTACDIKLETGRAHHVR